jgi:hypothetical protein
MSTGLRVRRRGTAALVLVGIIASSTTGSLRVAYAYDAPTAARVVVHEIVAAEPGLPQLSDVQERSVSPPAEPSGASTTPFSLSHATNTATGLADDAVTTVGTKISGQMGSRGWAQSLIDDALARPSSTVITRDTRWMSAGTRLNDPATAFIRADGSYVVRNDLTGDVVQISNRNDPNWIAPWD